MASLLPIIPAERRTAVNLTSNNTINSRRWGTDRQVYGGLGGAAPHVIRKRGVLSRSHRHYGSGVINCFAQNQPYRVTDLLLSDCRAYDQLLPPPLLTDKVVNHRLSCLYPTNHTYTSHHSKFAVFPLSDQTAPVCGHLSQRTDDALSDQRAPVCGRLSQRTDDALSDQTAPVCGRLSQRTDDALSDRTAPVCGRLSQRTDDALSDQTAPVCGRLSQRTDDALNQIHRDLYCTTTYAQTYSNHWSKKKNDSDGRVGEVRDGEKENIRDKDRKLANTENQDENLRNDSSAKDDEDETVAKCLDHATGDNHAIGRPDHCCPAANGTSCCLAADSDEREQGNSNNREDESKVAKPRRRVHWKDKEETENSKLMTDQKEEREDEKKTEVTAEQNVEEEVEKAQQSDMQAGVKITSLKEMVATDISQLPDHFRRVSAKYCHNKLSPMWPCSVPYYVSRPHSILQSYIFGPVKTSNDDVKSVNEMECVTMTTQSDVKGQDGHEVAAANLSQDINDDDVIGEFPPLSTMLHVSGYRIPHRLGVRFKSEAHARYHKMYPNPIPDLRESRVESKRYFFYNNHSSVFRGG